MDVVALKPQRAQLTALVLAHVLLGVFCAVAPAFAWAVALALPLVSCPLLGRKQQWIVPIACLVPCIVGLAAGYGPWPALSLLLPGSLCCGGLMALKAHKRLGSPMAIAVCVGAYAVALLLMVTAASCTLGASLAHGLTQLATQAVETARQPGLVLYQLAAAGLVNVPDGFQNTSLLMLVIDSGLIRQMLLSFTLTLETLLTGLLPALLVQFTLVGGLFTALRTQRLNCVVLLVGKSKTSPAERRAQVAPPPSFSLLTLPPAVRYGAVAFGVLGFVLCGFASSFARTLGLLMYTAFAALFELSGAAVMVGMLTLRRPQRRVLYGILTAGLYVLFPLALFLLGTADQILHFRSNIISNDQHKEEEEP